MENLYEALGLSTSASKEEIKKCYHQLLLLHHPDKTAGDSDKFHKIEKAWKVLGNDVSRKVYDAKLKCIDTQSSPVHDEVLFCDMMHNRKLGVYEKECRCGGMFILPEGESNSQEPILVDCDSCSLTILVKSSKNKS